MKPRNLFETFLLSAVAWIVLHAAVAPPLAFAALPGAVDQQAGAGAAQQEPLRRDEKIVVTADREAEDIRNVGSSVSVIGRDEIAASGARWLVDVLQFAPGVNVVRSGPAGSITQLFLRGSNTGHTLFLIDGVKVNSPTTGAYDLSAIQLAADQIERVEVHFEPIEDLPAIEVEARVRVSGKTGVEMEALVCVSAAALTIYDMCKSIDRGMVIDEIRLVRKSGGKSGLWEAT